jgi:hypothetical protein
MADNSIADFLAGKPTHTAELYHHFIAMFQTIGLIEVSAAKTMIGISNAHKRIAWVTQFGKNFIHVVFPFKQPHADNLCFTKIAQVPGTTQFNHHFRMLYTNDVNGEVLEYMKLAYKEAG